MALIIIAIGGYGVAFLGAVGAVYGVGKLLENSSTLWRYLGMIGTAMVAIPTFHMTAFIVYFLAMSAEHRLSREDEDNYD